MLLPSLILFLVNATLIADPLDNYWQQQVDYEMSITLHDSVRQITGNSVIKYTNQSPDSLDRIYMHLYPNAFQIGSVKYREYLGNAGRGYRAKYFKEKLDGFMSKVEIHDMSIALPDKEASWIHKIPILKEYEIDDLSDEAKAQLGSLNFADAELARLTALVAAMQTARNTYAAALKEVLGEPEDE